MDNKTEVDKDDDVVNNALDILRQRFATAKIFVQREVDTIDMVETGSAVGDVRYGVYGYGNYYANYGVIRHWLLREDFRNQRMNNG